MKLNIESAWIGAIAMLGAGVIGPLLYHIFADRREGQRERRAKIEEIAKLVNEHTHWWHRISTSVVSRTAPPKISKQPPALETAVILQKLYFKSLENDMDELNRADKELYGTTGLLFQEMGQALSGTPNPQARSELREKWDRQFECYDDAWEKVLRAAKTEIESSNGSLLVKARTWCSKKRPRTLVL